MAALHVKLEYVIPLDNILYLHKISLMITCTSCTLIWRMQLLEIDGKL